ncbi:MAG: serine hydrolase domain-containing protein [Gemmatimonadales bacterium]
MPPFQSLLRRPSLRRPLTFLVAAAVAATSAERGTAQSAVAPRNSPYFPPPGDAWERRAPSAVGMDSAAVAAAVAHAQASEINWSLDMAEQLRLNTAREPYPDILGPFKDRGRPTGLILRHGYLVAEWGDTRRVDMTFSVAKSYLSTVAGVAFDQGLFRDVDEPVTRTVTDGGFDSPHNAAITWRMLLTQTSEWEGTLWDKPDVADRREGRDRTLRPPGTFWEYNDVRVNRLALAVLRLFREPLPEVLRRKIMDPIGASDTWVWHGYRNSYVEIDGKRIQSVSGGGHWGGGVWATTRDHARFGYLMLRRGEWAGRRLLSERWIDLATTPTPIRPGYGYLWWLNREPPRYGAASRSSFFALGAGGNVIWIDPEHDLVVVARWLAGNQTNELMRLVTAAIRDGSGSSRESR